MYMNSAGRQLTGIGELGVLDRVTVQGLFPELQPDLKEENQVERRQTHLRSMDGIMIPVSVNCVTYTEDLRYSRDSEPPKFTAIFARELREEMEDREKLQRNIEVAQAAADAKSDFLATMSHEMRTPLHGIVGSVELLQGSTMDAIQEYQVNNIHHCCNGLLTIINDCLDFAKIEAKKIEFDPVPFSVTDCVDSCLSMLSSEIRRRQQTVHYRVCPKSATEVEGDSARIRQIVLNLMSNAVKFNRDGAALEIGICASYTHPVSGCQGCSLHACPQNPAFNFCWFADLADGNIRNMTDKGPETCTKPVVFRFFVKDHGRGMTQQQLNTIFEPFVQARSEGSSQGHGLAASETGTGLGLSIANRLLGLMNGGCSVRSLIGVGSCFSIWIPVELAPQKQKPKEVAQSSVLLISDDEKCRLCTKSILEMCSGSVTVSDWPAEAEDSAPQKKEYSAIFLNVPPHRTISDATFDQLENRLIQPHGKICLMIAESNHDETWTRPSRSKVVSIFKPVDCGSLRSVIEHSVGVGADKRAKRGSPEPTQADVHILVVEDNATNRVVLYQMLQAIGINKEFIKQAEDGMEALEMCRKFPFDIVLMDIHMPRLSGWEAARRIRRNPTDYNVGYIVALTAASTLRDRDESLKCMDSFVTKPLKIATLISVLTEACSKIGIHRSFQRALRRTSIASVQPVVPSWRRALTLPHFVLILIAILFIGSRSTDFLFK
jgi:signal transduction histidine kinase/CheY-like chemotaxis protein